MKNMNTKNIPALISLTAGLIALVVTYVSKAELIDILTTLFIVLLSFYILGFVVKAMVDKLTMVEEVEEEEQELENIDTEVSPENTAKTENQSETE
ncbi:MAG: hypothetical protein HFI75_10395 [Lachnospiraceae bacterium]|nr:hypothetical protein [Lachnospiraceae bacterium]